MDRLAELRERRALTLRELSEMSGVAADTINQIELGHRRPRPSTLRKLARALEVDVEEFYAEPALAGKGSAGAEQPAYRFADKSPETAPSLLDKALDAARQDEKKGAQAVNRLFASEGTLRNTNISDFEEDKLRAELRTRGFPDEYFEGFIWPLVVKAMRVDRLEQELARRLREDLPERVAEQAQDVAEQVAEQAQDTVGQVAEQAQQAHPTPVRNADS